MKIVGLRPGTLFDAVRMAGVRALVSAGWGGLGGVEPPPEVFILEGELRITQRGTAG